MTRLRWIAGLTLVTLLGLSIACQSGPVASEPEPEPAVSAEELGTDPGLAAGVTEDEMAGGNLVCCSDKKCQNQVWTGNSIHNCCANRGGSSWSCPSISNGACIKCAAVNQGHCP